MEKENKEVGIITKIVCKILEVYLKIWPVLAGACFILSFTFNNIHMHPKAWIGLIATICCFIGLRE